MGNSNDSQSNQINMRTDGHNNTITTTNNNNNYKITNNNANGNNSYSRPGSKDGTSSSGYGSSIVSVNRDETIMKEKNFYFDHVMIPSKFEGWIRNSLEECNSILAKVKEKSNARSIIIEQHVGDGEVEYRFTVTANG